MGVDRYGLHGAVFPKQWAQLHVGHTLLTYVDGAPGPIKNDSPSIPAHGTVHLGNCTVAWTTQHDHV